MTEPTMKRKGQPYAIYVRRQSPAGQAWAAHRHETGETQLWDNGGGWWFPTLWPITTKEPPRGTPGPMLD